MFIYFAVVHVVMYQKTYVDKCKSIHPNKFRICFDHKNLWVCYLNIFIVSDTKWYFLCQFLIQNKYVTTHKPHTKWGYHWGFGSCVDHITTDIDLSFIIATWTITQLFALYVCEQQCHIIMNCNFGCTYCTD